MYDFLEGRLASRSPTRVVLQVGGVGYDIAVPVGVQFQTVDLPAAEGQVRVWTHFVVREDSQQLFGFPDQRMREIFRLLLQVRGVGPGLAQAILSSLPGDGLLEAVANGDALMLTRIKGVGKKTADQILLDLRDKAPPSADPGPGVVVPAARRRSVALDDAVRALVSIGYSDKQARRSVEKAAERVDVEDLELLVRSALQE